MSEDATLDEFIQADEKKSDKQSSGELREEGFLTLPYNWSISTIADVAKDGNLVDGDWIESEDMNEDGEIQLVQLAHIGEGQFEGNPNRFITEEFAEEENCTILSEGDLLISRMQEPILRSCLLPEFERKSIMAVDIARLQHSEGWNRHFLKYLFNSRPIWKQGIAWASGTTRKRISRTNMEKLRLPTPSLSEQRQIATILHNVDQAIQKTEEVIEQLERVKEGLYQTLFSEGYQKHSRFKSSKYSKIPESWRVLKLSEITSQIQAGGTPDTDKPEYYGGDIPWVKTGELSQYRVTETEQKITKKGFKESTARLFSPGTILIAMYGATTGEVSLLDIEATTNQACCGVITTNKMEPEFLFHQLNHLSNYLESLSAGSGQQNISKGIIEKFDVLVPTVEEQNSIVSVLNSVDESIAENKSTKEQYQRFKQGLTQDLLSGTVRTTNTNIEVPNQIVQHG
jgi:type I restriction enzyme S subunit